MEDQSILYNESKILDDQSIVSSHYSLVNQMTLKENFQEYGDKEDSQLMSKKYALKNIIKELPKV